MIDRDLARAAGRTYDLVVVGGGVYGATLALEAARRGWRPVLVERADFGGATSWNSLRIVHGGLRYLQSLDLRRFRESVRERRWWLTHFPDHVHPLSCLMPLYGDGARRPLILRAALFLNDALSARRNVGVRGDRHLPGGRVLSPAETRAAFATVDDAGLRGAALWHDAAMPDSQRLLIDVLHWAVAEGATCLNYVAAESLDADGGHIRGVQVRDGLTGGTATLNAPRVVNCCGPWCDAVARSWHADAPRMMEPSLAFNVLLDHPPLSGHALAVAPRRPGARTYFLHPWKQHILAGTYHAPWSGAIDRPRPTAEHIADFLEDLNTAIPGFALRPDTIVRIHAGLLPARSAGSAELAGRPTIHDHGASGGPRGLISVSGVKFTTARQVAARTLAPWGPAPCGPNPRPAGRAVPGPDEFEALATTDPRTASALVRKLVAEEAVVHLDDLLLRRTGWGTWPAQTQRIARLCGEWLEWSSARIAAELQRLPDCVEVP